MTVNFPNESPEYRTAREALLHEEIALRRAMEAVAAARRKLPPGGLIPEDYVFDAIGPVGTPVKIKLSELFAPGKDSLVLYHFMFPRWPTDERPGPTDGPLKILKLADGPCPSCTAFLDSLDRTAKHLEAGGLNFAVVAKASIERLAAFAKDRGWQNLRMLSAAGNNFKRDYHTQDADGAQLPMTTVFHRTPGLHSTDEIRHFWTTEMIFAGADPGQDPRHNGTFEQLWNIFDLTPEGRPANWHEQLTYDCCSSPLQHPKDAFASLTPSST